MKIVIPPLHVTLDDPPTLEQAKIALLNQPEEVEGRVVPCYPDGTRQYAVVVASVHIAYWGSEDTAQKHLERIDKYFKNGGTFTSKMVLSMI